MMTTNEAPAGQSIQLSPARSSAFSTPSRNSASRASLECGGDEADVDGDVPSAVYSSFSLSPGRAADGSSVSSNLTPDRKPRIKTTITVSPKRNSPGLSAERGIWSKSNQSTPAGSVVSSPNRSTTVSAFLLPPLPPTPERTKVHPFVLQTMSPPRPVAVDNYEHSVQSDTLAQATESSPEVMPEGGTASAIEQEDILEENTTTQGEPDALPPAPVESPDAEAMIACSNTVSAPEKNKTEKATVVDPNFVLHQLAAGAWNQLTSDRSPDRKASVPFAPPQDHDEIPRHDNTRKTVEAPGSVVESVSSSVQHAFDTLRNYLTEEPAQDPATGGQVAGPIVAKVTDTSLEESAMGLDMQELVKEIREVNTKQEEEKKENEQKALESTVPEALVAVASEDSSQRPPHIQEGGSTANADALHKPIPISMTKAGDESPQPEDDTLPAKSTCSFLPPRLPANPPTAPTAPSRGTRLERLTRLQGTAARSALNISPSTPSMNKGGQYGTSASGGSKSATAPNTPSTRSMENPDTPSRDDGAITPIMRMRKSPAEEMEGLDTRSQPKTDEAFKADKQRKWMDKKKLAELTREQELAELDGRRRNKKEERVEMGSRSESKEDKKERSKKSEKKSRKRRSKSRKNADPPGAQCQNGFSKILDNLIQGRCGELPNVDTLIQGRCGGGLNVSIFDEYDSDSSYDSDSEPASDEEDAVGRAASTDEEESAARRIRLVSSDVSGSKDCAVVKRSSRDAREREMAPAARFQPEPDDGFQPDEEFLPTNQLPSRKIGRISLHEEPNQDPNSVGIHDKNFIHAFISGATNKGIVLYLHKKSRSQSFSRPSKMTAFLRLGSEPREEALAFVGPKLTWHAYDGVMAGRIDLFDIRSVDKMPALQLQQYPLAMPGRSLILKMHRSPDCVFEAMDEEAALRFVHGLRWVVARLAFNLIIGNTNVSCELLNIGKQTTNNKTRRVPETVEKEAQWTNAMNGLTNHLVDKSAAFSALA